MENYKELLLKYLTGNIDKEQPSDTLNYEELNTEDRAEIGIEEPFFVTNYLQCLDSKGVANGKTIVYGGIIQNNIVTGFIALFEGTELLFVTSQYNTGTTFGRFKVLQVDEAGQLYGIELFNDRYRFILLNNISEVSKTGVRQVVLRQSYYLQGSTQIEEKNYSYFYTQKSTQSASYLIVAASTEYPHVLEATNLKINVGSPNEWLDFNVQADLDNNSSFTPLNIYAYYDKDDEPHLTFYYISSSSNVKNLYALKNTGTLIETKETIIGNLLSFFNDGGYVSSGARLLPTGIDSFFFFLPGYTIENNQQKPKYFIIDYKSGIKALYPGEASVSGDTWQRYPELRFIVLNNTISIYLTMPVDPDTEEATQQVGIIATYDNNYGITKYLPNSTSSFNSSLVLFTSSYNLFDFSVIYTNTNNEQKISSWKIVFNPENYNNKPYENVNSLIADNGLLFNPNNSLIFARNLYNYKVYNNRVISVLNVPNTYLNNTSIGNKMLLSETNSTIVEDTDVITKNIYEDLYINNFITINMVNENEDISIQNKAGAINITQSAFKNCDYDKAKATKIKLSYDDGSSLITSASATISNGVATYEVTLYELNDKRLYQIDFMSEDESVIYQTITNETITKMNLEPGKVYKISQDVHIE